MLPTEVHTNGQNFPRLFFSVLVILGISLLTPTQPIHAAAPTPPGIQKQDYQAPTPFDIGSPTLTELWVNPISGDDGNSGLTSGQPLKTIGAAWQKIPASLTTTGYRINLQTGTYPCEPAEPDNCQNNFSNRTGTFAFPIIIRAVDGPETVTIRGGFDITNVAYLYLIDLHLVGGTPLPVNSAGNNLLHLASVHHVLLRGLNLDGPNCADDTCNNLQEVLKVNQAQYLYVENSIIGGAWHSSVDYFVVQYGHLINNELHTAGQWCLYLKGGTSYLQIEGNRIHDCQLGFSAGQSANFAVMLSPWLHYDTYDIKFVNNILHDLPGVGLSVTGSYNTLIAYNTLYRVGTSTATGYPLMVIGHAERGCNATTELPAPVPVCSAFITAGGWGPNFLTANIPVIPNRNVYIYNNLIYNPAPVQTMYTHFSIMDPLARPAGFINIPNPSLSDENLQIRGNLIWNGDAAMPLGIEGTQACTGSNPTCNEAQLRGENSINTLEPAFVSPAAGNYHPAGTWMNTHSTYSIPDFVWDIGSVPTGRNSNGVNTDYEGITRLSTNPPGAFFLVVPGVASIQRTGASLTRAASVDFLVTFSEAVTGVDAADFLLTGTGGLTGASISSVTGTGATRTVSVQTGTGSGNLRLDVSDNDTIQDLGGDPIGGTGNGNGDFTAGQSYAIRRGADTTGVFRPSNGALYLKNTNISGYADVQINYGVGGDYPITGDWNGDGIETIGIYRDAAFYLRNTNTIGFADLVVPFGAPGDQPIAGDWDGDGIDTIGIYRSASGTFFLRNSNTSGPPDMTFALGVAGDVGIAGDWDGDGFETTGVFRPSNGALYLKNTNSTGFADVQINYGLAGDQPVTGDWNDDGIDTIGIYRGGTFMLRNSNTIGFADLYFGLGIAGDMPISGNWDALP